MCDGLLALRMGKHDNCRGQEKERSRSFLYNNHLMMIMIREEPFPAGKPGPNADGTT